MKVFVVGEVCVDKFVYGTCERICPEAPVPVFQPQSEIQNNGMAGNVSDNLCSLSVECVRFSNSPPWPIKIRYVDKASNQMLLRVDKNDEVRPLGMEHFMEQLEMHNPDAVIVSDYDKGFLTEKMLIEIGSSHPYTFLDTKKPLGKWCCESFSFVKVNQKEFEESARLGFSLGESSNVIVTLGSQGCMFQGKTYPSSQLDIRDVSGAGDTFLASLVAHYIKHKDIDCAIEFANTCASYAVTKKGVTSEFPGHIVGQL